MPLDEADRPAFLNFAGWLADPARWYRGETGIDPGLQAAMAGSARLRPVLNDWLAGQVAQGGPALAAGLFAGVARDEGKALALGLLTAPDAVLERAARLFGAALVAERLRQAVLRSDRQRFADLLGPEAFDFAQRRAGVFARPLAGLSLADADDPVAGGLALCGSLIACEGQALFALFRLRCPQVAGPVALDARQVQAARAVLVLQGAMP